MIKHFAADGTVKREWPDGLHAAGFEQDGKRFATVAKSNAVETVELADGEQVGETFVAAVASVDVHPIETALSATPLPAVAISPDPVEQATSDVAALSAPETPENVDKPIGIVEGTGAEPRPYVASLEPSDIVMGTGPDAKPVIENRIPSEVVETAAHALSDAAEVLKQEEARNASSAIAQSVEPQEAQATHSTEAVKIPTSEAGV
jgi:hypothetical protein